MVKVTDEINRLKTVDVEYCPAGYLDYIEKDAVLNLLEGKVVVDAERLERLLGTRHIMFHAMVPEVLEDDKLKEVVQNDIAYLTQGEGT